MNGDLIPLPAGMPAPDFMLPVGAGQILHLLHSVGYPIVLAFYPTVLDPVSREQLTLYGEFMPALRVLDARVVGISTDDIRWLGAFVQEARICFPLASDAAPLGAVSRRYGVYREHKGMAARALFVLDHKGIIRFNEVYVDLLNPGMDGILTVLERLTKEEDRSLDTPEGMV